MLSVKIRGIKRWGDEFAMDLNLKTSMKINITQKARESLQKSNKQALYIEHIDVSQCCIPLASPPIVRKGSPRRPENFFVFEVDGITVYYDRDLTRKTEITVDTQGLWFSNGLVVSDWVIKY